MEAPRRPHAYNWDTKNSFQKEELKLRARRSVRVGQMQVKNHG